MGVEIIRLLKNFNTTKVALFRGCVPKIMSFVYKLDKWQGADEIVQKTAQNGAKLSVCLKTHKFCLVYCRATLCLFCFQIKAV